MQKTFLITKSRARKEIAEIKKPINSMLSVTMVLIMLFMCIATPASTTVEAETTEQTIRIKLLYDDSYASLFGDLGLSTVEIESRILQAMKIAKIPLTATKLNDQ